MGAVREKWTDERLDDLGDRVSEGFRRVDDEFRATRAEMNARFDSLEGRSEARSASLEARFDSLEGRSGARSASLEGRFDSLEQRFDAMQRTMVQFAGAMVVAMVGLYATLVGLILTQI